MEKALATILQYSEKKAIPIILYYVIIGLYIKASDSVDSYYTMVIIASSFVLTLIYIVMSLKHTGKDNTHISLSFMRTYMAKCKSQIRDMRCSNKYLEDVIRVFLYAVINSMKLSTEEGVVKRNYDDFPMRMNQTETNLKRICMAHNVPMEIFELLHDINEKKLYAFSDITSHIAITRDSYTELEKIHMTIIIVTQLTKAIIDTTMSAAEDLEDEFEEIIQKLNINNKYIIPMGEFDDN